MMELAERARAVNQVGYVNVYLHFLMPYKTLQILLLPTLLSLRAIIIFLQHAVATYLTYHVWHIMSYQYDII